MFINKTIAILGGTGSFGKAFLFHLLKTYKDYKSIIIYSRDEQKQFELKVSIEKEYLNRIEFIIGDIRDANRLEEALFGVDILIYAAAMKHMPIAEENPVECYKTNVVGTTNVVKAAIRNSVEKVIALSTDKAVLPINVYGASKLMLEKLILSGNDARNNSTTLFSVVRYANILGSRGSVVPFFQNEMKNGVLPITSFDMTRFSLTMNDGIKIVCNAIEHGVGGDIFIPKAPSYKIATVAEAVCPDCEKKEVGIRNGEKLSELMVSRFEAENTFEFSSYYVILTNPFKVNKKQYIEENKAIQVPKDFEYDSAKNTNWLSVEILKEQIDKL